MNVIVALADAVPDVQTVPPLLLPPNEPLLPICETTPPKNELLLRFFDPLFLDLDDDLPPFFNSSATLGDKSNTCRTAPPPAGGDILVVVFVFVDVDDDDPPVKDPRLIIDFTIPSMIYVCMCRLILCSIMLLLLRWGFAFGCIPSC